MTIKRILVIDDEADIREIVKVSLQITKQWEVFTADSSAEGIAIATAQQPDAILLDVMMPDMNGLDTLQHLSQNPATQAIPVILLTATVKVVTQRQYLQLGAKAVLIKPFDPGLIARQIEQVLGWDVM
ncbi:response regulator [Oculatella sp. LEGE 06141]|uniref:response regulator n=1 Tax=Oculatella sp. LEGE 06141 TaxID=1828648 RepID=UPI001882313A|nr:response regulator [Oculatella sp. LEGE 06141]MBE9180305.1 response regulator [Oculatella sp. LEGE 06141]